ncbi:RCC1 domain-containing protein [Sphingobacterium lactis]|uniref:RCC1 domain-containing protein n=1 Tax=Sphingobacterium lactis TaxID=797291 RepID=UPI003DA2B729
MNMGRKSILNFGGIVWLVIFTMSSVVFQSCKKDNDDIDDVDLDQVWGGSARPFPIYTIDDATYIVKEDGTLWARGRIFSTAPGANAAGYMQLESNVKKIANAHNADRLYVLRKDNSVWRSPVLPSDEVPAFANQKATEKVTDNVKDVVEGQYFAAILKFDGTVWAIGDNADGQFGLGTKSDDDLPLTQIASGVKQIAVGFNSIYLLKNDNTLWSAGGNLYGKLGYPTTGDQLTFAKVMDNVKIVRANGNNVMVIKQDRSAWSFGSNANGTQGLGVSPTGSNDPIYPHQIGDDVKEVFPMGYTCFFLKENGTLWASGMNNYGQMGMASPDRSLVFIQIAENVTYMSAHNYNRHIVILQNGKYRMTGRNAFKELQQSAKQNFTTFTDFEMP